MWDDIVGEPEGLHTPDSCWNCSYKCYEGSRRCCYVLLVVLFGPLIALINGCQFACLSFNVSKWGARGNERGWMRYTFIKQGATVSKEGMRCQILSFQSPVERFCYEWFVSMTTVFRPRTEEYILDTHMQWFDNMCLLLRMQLELRKLDRMKRIEKNHNLGIVNDPYDMNRKFIKIFRTFFKF